MAPISTENDPVKVVETYISNNQVMIFSKSYCPFCKRVKALFDGLNVEYTALELDLEENGESIQAALANKSGQKTVPNVYINGTHIGGNDDTHRLHQEGGLLKLIKSHNFDYDLVSQII